MAPDLPSLRAGVLAVDTPASQELWPLCLQPVSVMGDSQFLPPAVPHPPQTPSFCLAPQHAEFVFALRPCQLFPLPPSSCGFPSSLPDTGALCHLCTLADVFGEAASKPGPALSFGGPDSPHWRAALSTCITFLAEIGARILSALCGEV